MYTTNVWNQFHIYRRKIVVFLVISLLSLQNIYAQKVFNLPNYDNRKLHFGFYLALNSNAFGIRQSDTFVNRNDTISSISAPWGGGAQLGFIVSAKITDYFDLRLLPGVSFTERNINFKFATSSTVTQKFDVTYIEMPLLLKYKSARRGNTRMYVIGGPKFYMNANTKKKDIKPDQIRLNNYGFGVEYGFGIDIYNEMFKFAPEIRFSHGFTNMAMQDQYIYSNVLEKLTIHTVTLFFNFE